MSIISPHLLLLKAFQGNLQAMLLSSQIVQLGLGLQRTFSGVNHGMQVVPTQTTLDSASMCSLQSPHRIARIRAASTCLLACPL